MGDEARNAFEYPIDDVKPFLLPAVGLNPLPAHPALLVQVGAYTLHAVSCGCRVLMLCRAPGFVDRLDALGDRVAVGV